MTFIHDSHIAVLPFLQVADSGFASKIVRVMRGDSVKWSWEDCEFPHSITQLLFCPKHKGFLKKDSAGYAKELRLLIFFLLGFLNRFVYK